MHFEIGILFNRELTCLKEMAELANLIQKLLLLDCRIEVILENEEGFAEIMLNNPFNPSRFTVFLQDEARKCISLRGIVKHLELHREVEYAGDY